MAGYKGYVLLAVAIFVLAFSLAFSGPGQALAQNMKPLLVQITNLPLSITGTVGLDPNANAVKVTNGNDSPVPVSGTLTVGNMPSAQVLRYGRVHLSTSLQHRQEALPAGVVITDLVVYGESYQGEDCRLDLNGPMPGGGIWSLIRIPIANTSPITQVHLTSGLRSTSEGPLGLWLLFFSDSAHCDAVILWSGYEG